MNLRVEAVGPATGSLSLANFRAVQCAIPAPAPGQILVENTIYTVDPAEVRRFHSDGNRPAPIAAGDLIRSFAVGTVIESRNARWEVGTTVAHYGGWERYSIIPADALDQGSFHVRTVDSQRVPLQHHIGVLGNKGFSAHLAVNHFGRVRCGDRVLISGAAGAVGSLAGQFAKRAGATVVGIAGGTRKCARLTDLGFDAAVDYRAADFPVALERALPSGVDLYVDNVGGKIQALALEKMRLDGRVVICGMISDYELDHAECGPNLFVTVRRDFSIRGFLANKHTALFPDFVSGMTPLVERGEITALMEFVDGLENAPGALLGLMAGQNIGQRFVRARREAATH